MHEGERVRAGEQLMDGPSNPHDMAGAPARTLARWGAVLRVLGEKELQKYLVNGKCAFRRTACPAEAAKQRRRKPPPPPQPL